MPTHSYVTFMCVGGLGKNFTQIVELFMKTSKQGFTLPYIGQVTYVEVAFYLVSAVLGGTYATNQDWALNNMMGISFCVLGIKLINLSSYKVRRCPAAIPGGR